MLDAAPSPSAYRQPLIWSRGMLRMLTAFAVLLFTGALATVLSVVGNEMVWMQLVTSVAHFEEVMNQRERTEYFLRKSADLVQRSDDRYQIGAWRQRLMAQLSRPGPHRTVVDDFHWARPFQLLTRDALAPEDEQQLDKALVLALFASGYWGELPPRASIYLVAADGSFAAVLTQNGTQRTAPPGHEIDMLLQPLREHPMRNAKPYWQALVSSPTGQVDELICYVPLPSTDSYLALRVQVDAAMTLQHFQRQRIGHFAIFDRHNVRLFGDAELHGLTPSFGRNTTQDRLSAGKLDFRVENGLLLVSHQDNASGWRGLHGYPLWPLLRDRLPVWGSAIVLYLLAVATTLWFSHRMWRQALQPAARQAERVAESEAFNRAILHAAPVGLMVLRLGDGALVMHNERAAQLLAKAGPPQEAARKLLAMTRVNGQPITPSGFPDSSGHELVLAGHTLLVRFSHSSYRGEPVLLCSMGDIDQQKAVEAALAEAKRAADDANHAKSRFLATMSHEIRTPLHAVLAGLELLGAGRLSPSQRERLTQVDDASQGLLAVIDDVLDFSKIEAGELALHPTPTDVVTLVEAVARTFAPRAAARGLQLHCLIGADLPRILPLDGPRLTQVLNNLVGNAVKFTEQGKVTLLAERARDVHGAWLSLRVVDTGMGIARADQARLFEPFVQADSSRTRSHGGSGLGLSICHRLVALMQGRIELVSEPGLGSSFQVLLPGGDLPPTAPDQRLAGLTVAVASPLREQGEDLAAWLRHAGATAHWLRAGEPVSGCDVLVLDEQLAEIPADAPARRLVLAQLGPLHPHGVQPGTLSRYARDTLVDLLAGVETTSPVASMPTPPRHRVLVVDDHPVNRQVLCDQLQLLGQDAHGVGDGEAAIRWLADHPYDLVLTDLAMPGMDGYTLARTLRAQGYTAPIVAVTASVQREALQDALDAGFDRWLTKPLKLATLAELLHELPAPPDTTQPAAAPPMAPAAMAASGPPAMNDAVAQAYRRDLAQLDAALAADDKAAFLAALHAFKGALAVMGHEVAVQRCTALEAMVAAQGPVAATPAYDALRAEVRPLVRTGDDDAEQDSGDSGG
ncbi:ATP-binding protein [Chitiniphilus shinanonensis]|uniref:ATP-binding protein n=1 Tax=Chitiniphilus shinanonensis TaxID=553088 RepID=UPI0030734AAD